MESKPLTSLINRFKEATPAGKNLKNLDAAKTSEIDQISAKFLKDDTPVIAIYLDNINLPGP